MLPSRASDVKPPRVHPISVAAVAFPVPLARKRWPSWGIYRPDHRSPTDL